MGSPPLFTFFLLVVVVVATFSDEPERSIIIVIGEIFSLNDLADDALLFLMVVTDCFSFAFSVMALTLVTAFFLVVVSAEDDFFGTAFAFETAGLLALLILLLPVKVVLALAAVFDFVFGK